MVTRRCAICGSVKTVFKWPQDKDLANKWTEVLLTYHPNAKLKKSSGICVKHFDKEDFTNYDSFVKGKARGEDFR